MSKKIWSKTVFSILTIAVCLLSLAFNNSPILGESLVGSWKELLPLVKVKIPGMQIKGKPQGTMKNGFPSAKSEYIEGKKIVEIMVTQVGKSRDQFFFGFGFIHVSGRELMQGKINGYYFEQEYYPDTKKCYLKFDVGVFAVNISGKGIDNPKNELLDIAKNMDFKRLEELSANYSRVKR